jgi:hypothetical protein
LKFIEVYGVLYSFQKFKESHGHAGTSAGKGKANFPLPSQKGMCKLMKFHICSMKSVSQANQVKNRNIQHIFQ